jgi:hypothetical protein
MNIPAILSSFGTGIKQQCEFALTVPGTLGTVLKHSERFSSLFNPDANTKTWTLSTPHLKWNKS